MAKLCILIAVVAALVLFGNLTRSISFS